jgi:osmotically-inducible protein OsmY
MVGLALAVAGLVGCAKNQTADVTGNVRDGLKQAGLSDVSVTQDRDRGVVKLGGNVRQVAEKDRAEQIAKNLAPGQVVANEIQVLPNGAESATKSVNADLDKGIEANLDAALKQSNLAGLRHSTKMGVVTLKGDVESPERRAEAERVAAGVPNVQQVVNEIDVKKQRATTTTAGNK